MTKHKCNFKTVPRGAKMISACAVCGRYEIVATIPRTSEFHRFYIFNDKLTHVNEIAADVGISAESVRHRYTVDPYWWTAAGKARSALRLTRRATFFKQPSLMIKSGIVKAEKMTVIKAMDNRKIGEHEKPLPGWDLLPKNLGLWAGRV